MPRKKEVKKSEKIVQKRNPQEEQLKWILIVMCILIIVAFGIYIFIQDSKKFEYGGIKFEEVMFDKLKVYHSVIPIKDSSGNLVANYNLFLRNDPRDLREIPSNGDFTFKKSVVVILDPEAESGCEDSGIAGGNFFSFLNAAGLKATLAYSDEKYADERNAAYAYCRENVAHSTISIVKGVKNEIRQDSENCYVIEFKECDILKSIERFEVAVLAKTKGRDV